METSKHQENRDSNGILPTSAPLANPYVPYQKEDPQTYQSSKGIVRGTMFPGLDLPFMNMVNQSELSNTPLHQVQALNFAVSELGLYLDTHPTDQDALELFNQYVEMYEESMQKYEHMHGALYQMNAGTDGKYQWVSGPWPWEYTANK